MTLRIISAKDWPAVAASLPPISMLLDPLIPAMGKTLLHGPPGSGKSAMMWGVGNALAGATGYLGLNTTIKPVNVLLLSTDMSEYELKHRWNDSFTPLFDILCVPGFDLTKPQFVKSPLYSMVKAHVQQNNIQLVMVDALGGIHSGRSAREDEVADEVDHKLSEWLPDTGLLLLGHDRKLRYSKEGEQMEPGNEDFLGSQKWRANMTSQIHMWATGDYISKVSHAKSQVSLKMTEPIKLYIDIHGRAELFDEHRAKKVSTMWYDGVKELGIDHLTVGQQVTAVAIHYDKSERTVKRWRQLAGVSRDYAKT